ncbi:MAG: hypothetical protein H6765_05140 [Candidatus Peribacteria bacterium]|nr:MAG: hypothetical protein H6765_05140 [Candidatus Peribacteria bacterium]
MFITFWRETSFLAHLLATFASYVLTLFIAAIVLFFLPVFIASQTLPLLTEILPEQSKGKAA